MGYLAEITCLNPLDLRLTVDVVGYPSEGETILITVEEGSNTIFSVVTDCYGEALNHIHTLLEERGVEQLNAFVWTHPDSDHSMGISNLLDTFDKKRDCHIFLPAGLFSVTDHLSSIAPDSKTAFDHIKTHYIGDGSPRGTHIRKYHEISHDCDAFQRQEFRVRFVNPQDDSIDLRLIMMAPVSTQTLGFTYQTKSNLKPNPFSIVYL